VLESFAALLADSSVASNPTLLLMAANVYALEGNAPEALKLCNAVQNLELCAPLGCCGCGFQRMRFMRAAPRARKP
jgi:hypothetical protein